MSEKPQREWRFYISDMILFAENVLSYTHGLNQSQFIKSQITYDASVRNIELIGEAATHIPTAVRNANEGIPWRMLIATRNRLIHGYLGIDNDILWSIIEEDLPDLIPKLKAILLETTSANCAD